MGFKNDGLLVQEYTHDIAAGDAGTGTVSLHTKDNKAQVPLGAIVKGVTVRIETPYSGGTDLAWGNTDDPDGYSGAAIATASLLQDVIFNGEDNAAALLWDDTNDHRIYQHMANAADAAYTVTMTGTHTAGKSVHLVEYYMPESQG